MAGGASEQAARCIALMVQCKSLRWGTSRRLERQPRIIECHGLSLALIKRLRNPAHLRVVSTPIGIGFELPLQIAGIEAGEARRARTIAAPVQAMTGETGVGRAGSGPAESDCSAVAGEAIQRSRVYFGAANGRCQGEPEKVIAHKFATDRSARLFPMVALALAACKPPPEQRQFMPTADPWRGKSAIERVGCGSCHSIPGVNWPRGKVGPSLDGLAERALIAGKLPNEPEVLAAYIRNAPALVPESGMPAMPLSEEEARDIAAYLYMQGEN